MNRVSRIVGHLDTERATQQLDVSDCAFLDDLKAAPVDAILGMSQAFAADKDPRKINVSIGAYRTDEGKPLVLSCVRKAEAKILQDKSLNKEYLRQRGDPDFTTLARGMLFGKDAKCIQEGRVASCQTLSGTGSLRVGAEFIKRFLKGRTVYYSEPTWGTHKSILAHAGVNGKAYRYWDAKNKNLDIQGMLADLKAVPMGSIILLHAAAHNPTGVDPTHEQWKQIAEVCHKNGNICWFDSAYQGFATGYLDKDAFSLRYFASQNIPMLASQSFAKNFGLYGERIGTFSVVCANASQVAPVMSQIDIIIRNLYSNPPKHGANIVKTVLSDPALTQEWRDELLSMSVRISDMRTALRGAIEQLGTPGDWSHITTQIGMFSYTGLSPKQCDVMIKKHHIYMLKNGRISMAGVNSKNVKYMANAIADAVKSA
jgi:aspartate/tyrosine/aromatic aminotransferase